MPRFSLMGLQTGLNCYHYFDEGVIRLKSQSGQIINVMVKDGELKKETQFWDESGKKCKSIFIPGKSYKAWENKKLTTNEKYKEKTLRTKFGVSKYMKNLWGIKIKHHQRRSSSGGFCWEEVYWPSGQLMYRYSRSTKEGKFFRPDGSIWGSYTGKLNSKYLGSNCIIKQGWRATRIKEIYENGPEFHGREENTFTWFDKKGKARWQGQYKDGQRTGVWLVDYLECVFIRGVAVPKTFADAKPEEIDVYKVVSEKNAQRRAVLIDKIGINRVINELQGEIVDNDKVNDYALVNIRIAPDSDRSFRRDKIINLLKVKCPSTGAFYTLRVPPGIKDVNAARQWTFGVDLDAESKLGEEVLEFIKET